MAGYSRPKDGVAALACVPAIYALATSEKGVDARHKARHDGGGGASYFQNCFVAIRAPSAIAAIFAHTTSGSTAAWPTQVP